MNVAHIESTSSSETQQSTISTVLAKRKNMWDEARVEGITQRICNMAAKDMMSISMADKLAKKLNRSMESWGLTRRVIACVQDNVRNVVSANWPSRVKWVSVPCLAHILQLAVNNGFAAHLKPVIAGGLTVNRLRSWLTREHVNMLIFLKKSYEQQHLYIYAAAHSFYDRESFSLSIPLLKMPVLVLQFVKYIFY